MDKPNICKICNKRFKGGKAMGGHMRSHLVKLPLPPKQPPPPPATPSPPQRLPHSPGFSSSSTHYNHSQSNNNNNSNSNILRIRNINSSVMQMMMMQSPPPAPTTWPARFLKYRELDSASAAVVAPPSSMDSAVESDSTESLHKKPTKRRSKRRRKLVVRVAPPLLDAAAQVSSVITDTFSSEDCALSLMMLSRDTWKVTKTEVACEEKSREEEMEQEVEEEDEEDDDVVFVARTVPKSATSNQGGKYKCDTCKKAFQSYQALGGHRASHKRVRHQVFEEEEDDDAGDDDDDDDDSEEEPAGEVVVVVGRGSGSGIGKGNGVGGGGRGGLQGYIGKSAVVEHPPPRVFECPFCFKLFDSGQALGGHKKVHYYNNTNSNASCYNTNNNFRSTSNTNNAKASSSSANYGDNNLMIDLNLPAPEEEFEISTVSD